MGIDKRPIGIFDSGVGGLTVFKEIEKALPCESLVYFGDTARVPYGNKSKQTVIRFTTENILFLLKKKVKLIVIACNTSSSLALKYVRKIFNIPIIGVIRPAIEKAIKVSKGRIGVIGTKSTIASRAYEEELKRKDKSSLIFSRPCPLLVPFIEEGLIKGPLLEHLVKFYLKDLKGKIDTLILGCTHYPLIKNIVASYLEGVCIIDSAKEVAINTKRILEKNDLLADRSNVPRKEFYVTDDAENFFKLARMFLKKDIKKPKLVNV
ncbi:MAG: glutamate racemase [Candidatus Omnitrophica bacterium]|nr:glutamate racemase [Candidatus Omnitrophota bacterium]